MEAIQRLRLASHCHCHRLLMPISVSLPVSGAGAGELIHNAGGKKASMRRDGDLSVSLLNSRINGKRFSSSSSSSSRSSRMRTRVRGSGGGWFSGFGAKKAALPEIVKAGDPVLHEPARQVDKEEIGSENLEKIIDDMIAVMRKAPGVGLAAPQIGVPLKIIVLEDTQEYISYARKDEIEAQDRRPFDLTVIVNPKLRKLSEKTAVFFEGCLSVDGFRAGVERYLEVEVSGLGRDGRAVKMAARGWQARILQHECDHLHGTLYVDKMLPRTFRTLRNLDLPLPLGCPPLGPLSPSPP